MYFEKQKLLLCALHTVNNFLQTQAFNQSDFDDIAKEITIKTSDLLGYTEHVNIMTLL